MYRPSSFTGFRAVPITANPCDRYAASAAGLSARTNVKIFRSPLTLRQNHILVAMTFQMEFQCFLNTRAALMERLVKPGKLAPELGLNEFLGGVWILAVKHQPAIRSAPQDCSLTRQSGGLQRGNGFVEQVRTAVQEELKVPPILHL